MNSVDRPRAEAPVLQLQSGAASDEPAVPVGIRAPVLLGFATIFLFFGGFMGKKVGDDRAGGTLAACRWMAIGTSPGTR